METKSTSGGGGTKDGTDDGANDDELVERIRKNGREYVSKLDRIYGLLEPRAGLVVSYGNLAAGGTGGNGRPGGVKVVGGEEGGNRNMYSSRLEMRLAIERRNLMRELVRLERQDAVCGQRDDTAADGSATSAGVDKVDAARSDVDTTTKRKREDE